MKTLTLSETRRTTPPFGLAFGALAGAALVVAGIWNVLVEQHVSVDSPPAGIGPKTPPLQAMHTYYSWYATTVAQERAATIAGLVGVSGLVVLAVEVRRRLAANLVARAACTTLQAGGLVWIVGSTITIGGHRAVGLMATHGNPIETVNSIAFTTDVTSDAVSAVAFTLLGFGLIGIAGSTYAGRPWSVLSALSGLLALLVAYGYMAGTGSTTTYELGILAAVLTPLWLAWTGRLLDRSEAPA